MLVIDEHRLWAEGLRLLVDQDERFEVVGTATTVDEATARICETDPDVALVGTCLANRRALEAIGSVRGDASLVVVADTGDKDLLRWALEAGAAAVVADVAQPNALCDALHRAGEGETLFSPALIADVIRRRATGRRVNGHASGELTRRENQVLGLLAEGCDSKRIAIRLGLSVETARDYVQNVLEKLGAHSRVEAVVRAGKLGLIDIA
ncbi:MAG: response regulator transcription factor [Chloroflexota bacterium]|nr:response regulator transcription factor [Chloroflexota bacterium]MDE3194227.1 response regulator transcription factor [Chloroflexota bacterium]